MRGQYVVAANDHFIGSSSYEHPREIATIKLARPLAQALVGERLAAREGRAVVSLFQSANHPDGHQPTCCLYCLAARVRVEMAKSLIDCPSSAAVSSIVFLSSSLSRKLIRALFVTATTDSPLE